MGAEALHRRAEKPWRQLVREALRERDPESVIALLEPLTTERRRATLKRVIEARVGAVTLVMDAPHDPHNGAAVLRSCDAFGVGMVHVVERREAFSISNAVARGTEQWVDVLRHASVDDAVTHLRGDGFTLMGTHPEGELAPDELATIDRLALVMGNEHDGIAAELADACDGRVRVPMRGYVESLNVSVTAAILLNAATSSRSG
ncbi:MAG: RNA methyltransferase, partial [Myxococcota bacterium]